jgi:hypothetical protein
MSLTSNSRSVPTKSSPGVDQSMSPIVAVAAPPHPPPPAGRFNHVGTGSPTSPRRRDHIPQPPALTTSLSGLQYQGGGLASSGPTPTTLTSPFSQTNPSTYTLYTPSPGGARRGTSPMASRLSGGYTAAYNPQQWGPVAGSPQVGAAAFPQLQQHGVQIRQQEQSDGQCRPSLLPRTEFVSIVVKINTLTNFSS